MSADAGRELTRALRRRAGDGVTIIAARMVDWGALLFEGHRHEITLEMPSERGARFAGGIEEAEFALSDHIVADIVVIGMRVADGVATVEIEALTLADYRPGSSEGHEGHKGHKGHDRCGLRSPHDALMGSSPPERSARG